MIVHQAQADDPHLVPFSEDREECEKHQGVLCVVEHHETVGCPLIDVRRRVPVKVLSFFASHSPMFKLRLGGQDSFPVTALCLFLVTLI